MKKKIISIVLSLSLAFAAVSCGQTEQETTEETTEETEAAETTENSEADETTEPAAESETEPAADTQAPGGTEVAGFPEGAGSIYELYTDVVDFLNNGFHYDDLAGEFDPVFVYTFYAKAEEDFASGLSFEESYDSMARIVSIVEEQGFPIDDNGFIDSELIDMDAFGDELDGMEDPEEFIEGLYGLIYRQMRAEGVNPFRTGQTSWEVIPEDSLEVTQYDFYQDFSEGFEEMFPRIYNVVIGSYNEDGAMIEGSFHCVEYNGRYYAVSFSSGVEASGG